MMQQLNKNGILPRKAQTMKQSKCLTIEDLHENIPMMEESSRLLKGATQSNPAALWKSYPWCLFHDYYLIKNFTFTIHFRRAEHMPLPRWHFFTEFPLLLYHWLHTTKSSITYLILTLYETDVMSWWRRRAEVRHHGYKLKIGTGLTSKMICLHSILTLSKFYFCSCSFTGKWIFDFIFPPCPENRFSTTIRYQGSFTKSSFFSALLNLPQF